MLRAVTVLGGTVAGLAALLSFKIHPAPADGASAATGASTTTGTAAATPSASAKAGSGSAKASAGAKQRTVVGTTDNTLYGPMQIELTLSGKKITAVKVLQHTDDGTESQQIDSNALPKLTSETLTAQSARIDAVSGASYTSQGYIESLQSAVDKA